jgi:chemotaxis protein methyltransferase WspC
MKRAILRIEALLHDTMGLDVESIGAASVERAIRTRMVAAQISTFGEYWNLVKDSRAELQALIETVVVPETWFSRDAQAFAELTRVARDEWRRERPGAVRRLLSVPCSTGEEPYSMAMAMLDAGLSNDRFAIDAVDISERSIEQARRGIYGRNSFRGRDLAFRDQYFEPVAEGHRVLDTVRRGVHFMQGNVFDGGLLADAAPYDAIFCRNLLIYFDTTDQDRTIARLRRMLADDGLLFVGPAESSMLLHRDFVSAKVPFAFAFRKGTQRTAVPFLQAVVPRIPLSPQPGRGSDRHAAAAPSMGLAMAIDPTHLPHLAMDAPDLMDEAMALANQGRLADAEILCEEQLRQHGATADLLHLMGLICSASGRLSEADRHYRKALYLDQNHHESLMHLALLLEQQGDERGARLLRGRAQRQ